MATTIPILPGFIARNPGLTADTLSKFIIAYNFTPVFREKMGDHQVFSHYCCKKEFAAIDLFTGYHNGFYAQVLIKGNRPSTQDIVFPVRRDVSTLTNDYKQAENLCVEKSKVVNARH